MGLLSREFSPLARVCPVIVEFFTSIEVTGVAPVVVAKGLVPAAPGCNAGVGDLGVGNFQLRSETHAIDVVGWAQSREGG
ncbi:MAG: hypothetical protein AAGA96_11485 [Verrucomicrobiota bacterium]